MKRSGQLLYLLIPALLLLAACATPEATSVKRRYVWPSNYEDARIEWIANYSSNLDLKAEKGLFDKIVGEDLVIPIEKPIGVTSDGLGRIFVTRGGRASGGTIYMLDLNKREMLQLGGESFQGVVRICTGITVDGAGNVYVADSDSRKVHVIDIASNRPVKVLDFGKELKSIALMTIDKKNSRIVLPDYKGNRVLVADLAGATIVTIGKPGAGNGEFNRPNAVAVESDGVIVVADSFNARIQRFDKAGKFLSKFGTRGDGPTDFALIKGVAVDSEDHIYVTDGQSSKLAIFSNKGESLLSLGEAAAQHLSQKLMIGGFLIPQGIYIDQNDRIYIADQLNHRIQVFQYLNEKYLKDNPLPAVTTDRQPAK